MDFNTCCMYFCTGISAFGIIALLFMYGVLSSGGEWFLGVGEEDAPAAASACLIAAGIYLAYFVFCMGRMMKGNASPTKRERLVDDDV